MEKFQYLCKEKIATKRIMNVQEALQYLQNFEVPSTDTEDERKISPLNIEGLLTKIKSTQ